MSLHVSSTYDTARPSDVRHYPGQKDKDFAVQVFLGGDARHSIYMSVETAREFAQQILDVLPAPVTA